LPGQINSKVIAKESSSLLANEGSRSSSLRSRFIGRSNLFIDSNLYVTSFSISWHRLLCHSLVRSVLMAAGPHPLTPSPNGEGAAQHRNTKYFVLPHQLLNIAEHK
jgi:hypothetical protein